MAQRMILAATMALAAGALIHATTTAAAQGLTKAGPRVALVEGAKRHPIVARQTSSPLPLSPGVFLVPFNGTATVNSTVINAPRFQLVDSSFARQGDSRVLTTVSSSSFAENSGARLANGKTQVVTSVFTANTMNEVFGFSINPDGTPIEEGVRLTRSKDGNQGGPTVVPMKGGTSFTMWLDGFHEAGESDTSVRGVFGSTDGLPAGDDFLIESKNTGQQSPADGAQLRNGRLLLVWRDLTNSDITGRWLFRGRLMSRTGKLIGRPFLLGASNTAVEMRVAALPNGNFVAVWLDDRSGSSLPYYRIFSPKGEPLAGPQLLGSSQAALGNRLDVAALSDSSFVIAGNLTEGGQSRFIAQLFTSAGQKVGAPLVLHTSGNPEGVAEHHIANAGYLLGQAPPVGGIDSASDARRVYVVWRINRAGGLYDLFGQVLRTKL